MQAQVVNLLMDLQARFGISYLFIAHDLAVVRAIAHRVAVSTPARSSRSRPRMRSMPSHEHPYTKALLDAAPRPDPARVKTPPIGGEVPSLLVAAARLPISHAMSPCDAAMSKRRAGAARNFAGPT